MANGNHQFVYLFGGVVILALVILVVIEAMGRPAPYVPPSPTPVQPSRPIIGGCAGTRWGCCADGVTPRADPLGTNCGVPPAPIRPVRPRIGGCAGTRWGCCPDGVRAKSGPWDTC